MANTRRSRMDEAEGVSALKRPRTDEPPEADTTLFTEQLRQCVMDCHMPLLSIRSLLSVLRNRLPFLPASERKLLKLPDDDMTTTRPEPSARTKNRVIEYNLGMDGLFAAIIEEGHEGTHKNAETQTTTTTYDAIKGQEKEFAQLRLKVQQMLASSERIEKAVGGKANARETREQPIKRSPAMKEEEEKEEQEHLWNKVADRPQQSSAPVLNSTIGRRRHDGWTGFTRIWDSRRDKFVAECNKCNYIMTNTSKDRLFKHRCSARQTAAAVSNRVDTPKQPVNSLKQEGCKNFIKKCITLFVSCHIPFAVIEDCTFKELILDLCPTVTLPSCTELAGPLLDQCYAAEFTRNQQAVQGVQFGTIFVNRCSANETGSYTALLKAGTRSLFLKSFAIDCCLMDVVVEEARRIARESYGVIANVLLTTKTIQIKDCEDEGDLCRYEDEAAGIELDGVFHSRCHAQIVHRLLADIKGHLQISASGGVRKKIAPVCVLLQNVQKNEARLSDAIHYWMECLENVDEGIRPIVQSCITESVVCRSESLIAYVLDPVYRGTRLPADLLRTAEDAILGRLDASGQAAYLEYTKGEGRFASLRDTLSPDTYWGLAKSANAALSDLALSYSHVPASAELQRVSSEWVYAGQGGERRRLNEDQREKVAYLFHSYRG